jgi:hypothetical protein
MINNDQHHIKIKGKPNKVRRSLDFLPVARKTGTACRKSGVPPMMGSYMEKSKTLQSKRGTIIPTIRPPENSDL